MSTRKLTEIAQDLLDEAAGNKKQMPDLLKLINAAINQYAKSEHNEENMLDIKVISSSISDGKLKVDLGPKGEKRPDWDQSDNTFEFVLVPKRYKKPVDAF